MTSDNVENSQKMNLVALVFLILYQVIMWEKIDPVITLKIPCFKSFRLTFFAIDSLEIGFQNVLKIQVLILF